MSEKSNMPPPGDKLATYEVGSPQENLGANAEGGNTRAQTSLERSLKSLGHEPDNAPAPSDSAVKPMETGTEISTEPAKTPGESAEKPRTEFEQQQEEAQEKLQNILDERQKLAEMGKQLDTKESEIKIQLETQEREGVERSKEARKALDEISHLIPDGAPNPHRDALKKTLENLPDKMTAKDVANFTEGARWDAAKASVGDKDFANMSQTEKDVVLERVKKMQENATQNPDSALWGNAKKESGLSPDQKWTEMSPAEQKLVQERFADAKAKAHNKDIKKPNTPPVAPAPAKTPIENKPSAPAPDAKKPNTPTVIDKAIGFDQVQGRKHGSHTELDKKLSDGSMVSVYNKDGLRVINIGKNLRFADDNAYDGTIKITLKNDGSVGEITDTSNYDPIPSNRRMKILEELKKIGLTLSS